MRNVYLFVTAILLVGGCTSQSQPESHKVMREDALPADAVKITPDMDLYPPLLHSDEWESPVPLDVISTAGAEDSPFILPDGNTLYFWFTPDVDTPPQEQVLDGVTGIYVSFKQNGQWSTPERVVLQDQGEAALDGCAFVQGNVLWFCSVREGNYGEVDMYTAEQERGEWVNWKNAGRRLNAEFDIGELHLCGSELYFHSGRAGGKGGYDIYVTRKVDGEWQPPVNVEAVNTPESEGWPFLTQDCSELWFTRTYNGSPAIFRSRRVNGNWGEPELILSQFAGEPSLDNNGNLYFVHHFSRDGRMVEADIYVAYHKRPNVSLLSGLLAHGIAWMGNSFLNPI